MIRKLLSYANVFYAWQLKKKFVLDYLPEDISIELTNSCNFKCTFCPQSDPHHFDVVSRSTLSPTEADLLLSKIRAGGVRTDVLHWTLDGEPFINRNIDEICRRAIEHRFKHFIFSTNGYFCTSERLGLLPGANEGATYTLCIDFCSNPALFERHRGTPASWPLIRQNVLDILRTPGLSHINLQVTDISSFVTQDHRQQAADMQALQHLFPASKRLRITSRTFHNVTGFIPGILEQKRARNNKYHLCPYPWASLVIASNGDVVSCCRDLEHKTILGNLFTEDLPTIWNGQRARALRKALVDKNPQAVRACESCDLPYDDRKFRFTYWIKTGTTRLGIFK